MLIIKLYYDSLFIRISFYALVSLGACKSPWFSPVLELNRFHTVISLHMNALYEKMIQFLHYLLVPFYALADAESSLCLPLSCIQLGPDDESTMVAVGLKSTDCLSCCNIC